MPGVVLTKDHNYNGMISRRRFFEFMSRPYSNGLFRERALESLYDFIKSDVLVVGADTTIVEATQQALFRNSEFVYEPIVVRDVAGKHRLLDIQQLLLANSKIHALTIVQLEEAEKKIQIASKREQGDAELLLHGRVLALEEIIALVQREVTSPAKLAVGNLVHASRYIQELIQMVGLYQKYYPQPIAEIQTVADKMKVDSVNTELPKLLNVMKGNLKKIQGFGDSLAQGK
jgi:hypothetical protein